MANTISTAEFLSQQPRFETDRQADPRHPNTAYRAVYPYNQVTTTEGGHQIEVDNTPGHERLRWAHRSGTYREIAPNGRLTEVVVGNEHRYVRGGSTTTVDGTADTKVNGASRTSVAGDSHSEVAGRSSQVINGDSSMAVNGNAQIYTRGSLTHSAEGDATSLIKGNSTTAIEGNVTTITSGNRASAVAGDDYDSVEGNKSTVVVKTYKIDSQEKVVVTVGSMEIEITTNQARIKHSNGNRAIVNDLNTAIRTSSTWLYVKPDGVYTSGPIVIAGPPTEY